MIGTFSEASPNPKGKITPTFPLRLSRARCTLVYQIRNDSTKSSSMNKLFSATKLQIATYILGVCFFSVCTFQSLSQHRNCDTFSALLLFSCHRICLHPLTVKMLILGLS